VEADFAICGNRLAVLLFIVPDICGERPLRLPFLDFANLMIHECGHPLFSGFGYTAMILGGTLAELIVPLLCTGYFF